ncbi:hypothetical protein [Bradyrhizobium sp. AUGA SZCCT0182]|uniref:hypothetical protein n=1 Tax=Bradyrhizobium sp. AUGA SZCCT0182 TaxID=2807667 RepID=UPI001BAB408E|nr:hypothetical protein [Bradyrhizobium sp. AUGA SZCCT0182]MBR1235200.1 hypothetical protein [Bradyrhizobium sp. AUGA SZCCT0182]
MAISKLDWDFDDVRRFDNERAERLEGAPDFNTLGDQVCDALVSALSSGSIRFAVDSYRDAQRAIVQFRLHPNLYDLFFNARSGYRAQYWISAESGLSANKNLMRLVVRRLSLGGILPETIAARLIQVEDDGFGRKDVDIGETVVAREFVLKSLSSDSSKIWVSERLIGRCIGPLEDLMTETLRSACALNVKHWPTAQAPLPQADQSWFDIKGAYEGIDQPKSALVRALDLHNTGWS